MSLLAHHAVLLRRGDGPGPEPGGWANVSTLLHLDALPIVNVKDGRRWEKASSGSEPIPLSTTTKRFGAAALTVDTGRHGIIRNAKAWGPTTVDRRDFTIEGFMYVNHLAMRGVFQTAMTGNTAGVALGWTTTTTLGKWQIFFDGTAWESAETTRSLNTWVHYALVRYGNVLTLYLDGAVVIEVNVAGKSLASREMHLGAYWNTSFPFVGYLDEFRMTMEALYTGPFTVPTEAFPGEPPGPPPAEDVLWQWDNTDTGWSVPKFAVSETEGLPPPSFNVPPGASSRIDTGLSFAGREYKFGLKLTPSGVALSNAHIAGNNAAQYVNFRVDGRSSERTGPSNNAGWTTGAFPSTSLLQGQPMGEWLEFGLLFHPTGYGLVSRNGEDIGLYGNLTPRGSIVGMYTDGGGSTGGHFDNMRLIEPPAPSPGEFLMMRVYITASNEVPPTSGSVQCGLGEVEFLGETLGDRANDGLALSGGNTGGDSAGPGGAFDGSLATDGSCWMRQTAHAGGANPWAPGIWVGYHFARPQLISRCRMAPQGGVGTAPTTAVERCPRDFLIQGSNDGVNWTTLKTVVNETGWVFNEFREFTW